MRKLFNVIVMAIVLAGGASARAADTTDKAAHAEPGPHSVRAFLGFISPDNENKLGDDDGAAMLNVAYEYRLHRNFAVGGELQAIARNYRPDAAPAGYFGDPDRDSDVDSAGIAGTFRGFLPLGSVELYGGVGVGMYYSDMSITGETNNVDGTFYKSDSGFGYFGMLGADIRLARQHAISVEFRKLYLDANFGKLTNGDVDIGGDIFAIGYQYRF